ncbi:unnamed protein product [Heterobilharzia americana]|nr:unnamed protein product [Heterobilharzia americana]
MKPDKCYSQLFRDVSILPHWMVQNERQYSRTQNDYDDNDDDDDDCGDYSLGTSRMQLYRTFSWPRMNSEVSYDRFEEPMDLCYPQSNDENSFQYSLNEDNVGSLQKENLENRDTPTTIKENGKYQESSNKEQVYQSSESVVLSNSLIKMDSKRNQHVHQQSPEGTRISDKNNDNELDDEKDSSDSGLLDISTANSIQVENKVKPRVSDQINDLLDDINFVSCLDRIYNPHIRSQYQDLINSDYKPEYRQLFCEAFNLIKSIRSGKPYKLS